MFIGILGHKLVYIFRQVWVGVLWFVYMLFQFRMRLIGLYVKSLD
jgi:hypothetical protein